MSKELFHAILNKEFYLNNKDLIQADLFEHEIKDLFNVVAWAYESGTDSLTPEELNILFVQRYPATTEVKKSLITSFLDSFKGVEPIQPVVATLALKQAMINAKADEAAMLLVQQSNTKENKINAVRELLSQIEILENGKETTSSFVDLDIDYLLERTQQNSKWKFNIPAVSDLVGGIGSGTFSLIAGRVNTGKSLAALSFCFGPEGFAQQGAKILYLCNEEHGAFPGLRAVSCFTGMTKEEIHANKSEAAYKFREIKDNIKLVDDSRISMASLEKMCDKYHPDILVMDMIDHIRIAGEYAREDQRLGQLYRQAREIAKVYELGSVGVSQTSAESDGKLHYGFDSLAGSKTDKAAACDLIMLIGAEKPDDTGMYSTKRAINIAKNKITGRHGPAMAVINPFLSRLIP